jgi:hypothetical protein
MHVISASRRTDIPAFHAEWFINRIRSGHVGVLSPFGGGKSEVSLAAEDVIAVVFWTKNARPILQHLGELRSSGYCFTFLYTINNYPISLEPRVPDLGHTVQVLNSLIERFPGPILRWRYDTIVLTDILDRKWHMENFRKLCGILSKYSRECIFSFCDYYKKTIRNMELFAPAHVRPDEAFCVEMAGEMAELADEHGISLASCAHDYLVSSRVAKARCIDPDLLLRVADSVEKKEAVKKLKISPTRKECGCAASFDIGAYDTCYHGCVYCYANASPTRALDCRPVSDPASYCLDPRYHRAKQSS